MKPTGESRQVPTRPEEELERAVREGTEQLLARVGVAFAAEASWADGLRAVARGLRDFLREDPDRAQAMVLEAPFGDVETRRIREEGAAALAALIDLGRAELADPSAVPKAVADITAGAIYNRIHLAIEAGEELSDEMVRELMFTAILPYRGLEAAVGELEPGSF
jgi:hypothetical protein